MRTRLPLAAILCLCVTTCAVADDKSKSLNNPPEGFTALFNGEDLSGWIGMRLDPKEFRSFSPDERKAYLEKTWGEVTKHWSVDDGILVNDGHGPYLTTAESYGDFELHLDYKTVAGADSGIYLRGVPQVQIWDTTDPNDSLVELRSKGSAGLFNNKKHANAPLVKADKPFGEWNHLDITMIGDTVTVVYNGKLVVNEVTMENYWDRSIPIYPVGPIQLQTHGGEIRFRNIAIREIPRKPPEAGYLSKTGKPFGDGWIPLLSKDALTAKQTGDVEYHVLFSLQENRPAQFTVGGTGGGAMVLTVSPKSGVTLTDHGPKGPAIPLANTPAAASGLHPDGDQHLYARIRGNSIQIWLNETPVVDVLYPQRPKSGTVAVKDAYVKAAYLRNAADDPHVEDSQTGEKGFQSLYNGKDLSGWTGNLKGYEAQPNVLVATKNSGNLLTKKAYGDFKFRFEFKLKAGANNGVGIRAPIDGHPSYDGMEIQILDNTADRYANLKTYQYHGSVYGIVPAKRGYLKPIGYWNQEEIIVNGGHIRVTLNGKVIVDANLTKASKDGTIDHREHPGADNTEGHIGFLGHGHIIEFRNIQIKPLK